MKRATRAAGVLGLVFGYLATLSVAAPASALAQSDRVTPPAPPSEPPPPPPVAPAPAPPPRATPVGPPPPVVEPGAPAAPQPGYVAVPVAPVVASGPPPGISPEEYEEWQALREERLQRAEEAREDRKLEREAKLVADRLRRSPRIVLGGGLGLSLAPLPPDMTVENSYRFDLGVGFQQHFTNTIGFQGFLSWGIAGVTRPNVTTTDQRSFINSFQDVTLEALLLFGPFGRFYMGFGPWLSVGGYTNSSAQTVQRGTVGTSFFPDDQSDGNAIAVLGPDFSLGAYIGREHRLAVGAKLQPGVILTSAPGSMFRLEAAFSVFLP